ncbi:hypothetical protein [Fusobacterium ulcerans]|uniref:hypothetical protein n=1 Tax=Fusobacterium ulcerans TaxID=861 RepID=UPI0030A19C79
MYKISIPNFDEGINARIESAQTAFEREEEYYSSLKNIEAKSEIQINELKLANGNLEKANNNLTKTNFNLTVQIEQWKVDYKEKSLENKKLKKYNSIMGVITFIGVLFGILGYFK